MMMLEELQKKLESYSEKLEKALVHQSKSEAAVEQIQEEIKLAQSGLTEQENPEGEPAVEGETYEQVRLHYDTRAAELELQIRKNPAAFGIVTPKPTESTIRAVLRKALTCPG